MELQHEKSVIFTKVWQSTQIMITKMISAEKQYLALRFYINNLWKKSMLQKNIFSSVLLFVFRLRICSFTIFWPTFRLKKEICEFEKKTFIDYFSFLHEKCQVRFCTTNENYFRSFKKFLDILKHVYLMSQIFIIAK